MTDSEKVVRVVAPAPVVYVELDLATFAELEAERVRLGSPASDSYGATIRALIFRASAFEAARDAEREKSRRRAVEVEAAPAASFSPAIR
jgi:hypothetical protein